MKLLVINGPNLNLLGRREPEVYGERGMDDCLACLRQKYASHEILYYQSNIEGCLIDRLQQAMTEGVAGAVLNAGAYTHTSIALYDCIRSLNYPVVEVHLSNVHSREDFRRHSYIAPACCGVIAGFGIDSYRLAIEALVSKI